MRQIQALLRDESAQSFSVRPARSSKLTLGMEGLYMGSFRAMSMVTRQGSGLMS